MKVEIIKLKPATGNSNLLPNIELRVKAGGFKFIFGNPASLIKMIEKFEDHPRGGESARCNLHGEHFHQSAFARLPMRLKKAERRKVVAKRLREAMEVWKKDPDSQFMWRAHEALPNSG